MGQKGCPTEEGVRYLGIGVMVLSHQLGAEQKNCGNTPSALNMWNISLDPCIPYFDNFLLKSMNNFNWVVCFFDF